MRQNKCGTTTGYKYHRKDNTPPCRECLDAPRKVGVNNWELGFHVDHLVPLSKGGSDTLENVRPTHAVCNLRKNAKELQEHNNVGK